jgi:PAS domain S-box-containing protein
MLINDACAEFFGIEEGNVVGRHFLEAIYDGRLFESIESLAKGGGERNGRIVRINKGGEYYFNLIVTKVNDPDMRNACVIAAFQNVTGLKELERVRTDFLATISHEFKTPLTSIMMASSLLKEEGMGGLNAEQAETVNAISEDGDRLLALVNNLLELMKIESGREVYHIQPCSVKEAVDASLKGFEESARAKSVRLSNNVAAGLPDVSADFEKIRWVVNNLIGNALKYTGAGGAVSIKANHDGKFVYISVQDTGAGIPPAYIDRIFDRFVQVERSDIEVSGTGIGLSLSKEIIRAHGGDIRVSSEMSKGSTFTFSLKIAGIEHAK